MGYLAHLVAMEEISRASGSVGLSYGAHSNLCVQPTSTPTATEAQKREIPAEAVQRRVEGRAGDERAGRGFGRGRLDELPRDRKGDVWVANGNKMWITNGPEADVLVVYMRTAGRPRARASA